MTGQGKGKPGVSGVRPGAGKPTRPAASPRATAPRATAPRATAPRATAPRSTARGAARAGASRPGTPRPASSRPGSASRSRTATPDPRTSPAWVRGAILASILVMLAVTLAPTARSLMRQRGDIAALQDKVVQQEGHAAQLQKEQARWADPAYVEQQARERLKFVKVGDRSYSVIDGKTNEAPQTPTSGVVAAPAADDNAPWYGRIWQSVQVADRPTAGMPPVPAR